MSAALRTRARGELEGGILRILWDAETPLSAKEIQEAFDGHTPAYTTVMTSLERLQKKGQVIRSGDSPRKVRFEAARTEHEHASEAMLSALDGAANREAALLRFAGNLDAQDMEVLRLAMGGRPRTAGK
ncbi:MAG: CopY family transcriptional regulator [Micrococcales bacterium 73-13]|nr:MAG: CopY family transcriptional regulator [Micrococcales bacterium 73-13]